MGNRWKISLLGYLPDYVPKFHVKIYRIDIRQEGCIISWVEILGKLWGLFICCEYYNTILFALVQWLIYNVLRKTIEEVNSDIKQYTTLTQNQGQIRIAPGNRQKIQAFIQWSRDMVRTGRETSIVPFPIQDVANLIRNYKSHKV